MRSEVVPLSTNPRIQASPLMIARKALDPLGSPSTMSSPMEAPNECAKATNISPEPIDETMHSSDIMRSCGLQDDNSKKRGQEMLSWTRDGRLP